MICAVQAKPEVKFEDPPLPDVALEEVMNNKFEGLDVLVKEDGVFLVFESGQDGAMIDLEAIAEGRGKVTQSGDQGMVQENACAVCCGASRD